MAAFHISEAEAAKDLSSVLSRIDAGDEVVIERGSKPTAVIRLATPRFRTIDEAIAMLPEHSEGVMDADFARDVQAGMDARRSDFVRTEWD